MSTSVEGERSEDMELSVGFQLAIRNRFCMLRSSPFPPAPLRRGVFISSREPSGTQPAAGRCRLMPKEPIYRPTRVPTQPDNPPLNEPETPKEPVQPPPADPNEDRPMQDPLPPDSDLPRS